MKVKLTPQAPQYPYLGIHREDLPRHDPLIVFWTEPNIGVVVSQNEHTHRLGVGTLLDDNFRNNYGLCYVTESAFRPYEHTITLSN